MHFSVFSDLKCHITTYPYDPHSQTPLHVPLPLRYNTKTGLSGGASAARQGWLHGLECFKYIQEEHRQAKNRNYKGHLVSIGNGSYRKGFGKEVGAVCGEAATQDPAKKCAAIELKRGNKMPEVITGQRVIVSNDHELERPK